MAALWFFSKCSSEPVIPLWKHLNGFLWLLKYKPKSLHIPTTCSMPHPMACPCWPQQPSLLTCCIASCLCWPFLPPALHVLRPLLRTLCPLSFPLVTLTLLIPISSFLFHVKQYFPETPPPSPPHKTRFLPSSPHKYCPYLPIFSFRAPHGLLFCWWMISLFPWPDHKILSGLSLCHPQPYPSAWLVLCPNLRLQVRLQLSSYLG